jgi:hypothetical protein
MKTKPKGRPTGYSDELAAEICRRISLGESLQGMCAGEDLPTQTTVYRWLQQYETFREMYAQAREDQADFQADELVKLADEEPLMIVDDKGVSRVDSAWVAWQKNRIDTRKWTASKLKPRKYGDKVGVEHSGNVGLSINIDLK